MVQDGLYIGIDSGTQGTKGLVLDAASGKVLAESYAPHELIENNQGRREQDPAWWIQALEHVLTELSAAVDGSRVLGMGVSGQQHGMVPLDEQGEVLRPAKLWCDTETSAQCETITGRAGGPEAVIQAIGNSVAAGFTASKVLWLQENEPELFARLHTVLLPHDYLNFWLTGERKTECGDASGTAYFDVRTRKWSPELLAAVDSTGRLAKSLPELVESHEPVGMLRPELCQRFGFGPEVVVSSGGGDNMMAAIGTGNVAPGVVTASLGTSGTIYANAAEPVVDPGGELAAFCSSDGAWLPLVCTMNVTVSTELTRDLLELDTAALNAAAAAAPVGAQGMLLVPYFNGERTPALPRATASLHGLTSANYTRSNLCRAAMEGAVLGLRYGLDVLRKLGVDPSQIRLVGGGAKSALWREIVANVFDCPVVRPEISEAGALGAALQAMWCWSHVQGQGRALPEITERYVHLDQQAAVSPDAPQAAAYEKIYQRYLEVGGALVPLYG